MANSFEEEQEAPEMETLANLAENLVYRLPGCTDLMIRKTIREVYRDFCRRSCCLRVRRHFTLEQEQSFIDCPTLSGHVIDAIAYVNWNGRRLVEFRDYRVHDGAVCTIHLAQRLVPAEDCEDSVLPEVEVCQIEYPDIGCEEAPGWFLRKHGDAICSGVFYRLMSMTGKAWSDTAQATEENVAYENAICEARLRYYAASSSGNIPYAVDTADLI